MMGETRYSAQFDGDRRNYGWPVRFDVTDGYVGIVQWHDDSTTRGVLLSPEQIRGLKRFLQGKKRRYRRAA